MTSSSGTQNDPRWNLVRALEPPADLRTSISRDRVDLQHEDDEDQASIISSTQSQSRASSRDGTPMIEGNHSYSRTSDDLDDLVECFRENVEENMRRQQQLGPCLDDRIDSATISSSCSTPNSTCELVSALQNHLKSAVAVATAAAAAAAAAAATNQQQQQNQQQQNQQHRASMPKSGNFRDRYHGRNTSSNGGNNNNHSNSANPNHHELIPLDLKMLPGYEIWQDDATRSSRSDDDDDHEVDLISIEDTESGQVQHTEIVQTTVAIEHKMDDQAQSQNNEPISLTSTIAGLGSVASTTSLTNLGNPNNIQQQQQSTPTNSHGHHVKQRRLYKCRHCSFETDKKVENWQHIRIHMRPEKLLSCGSCLFVTEYKHHLEYHQRNHTGYKPFKCEHCDYTCVNKSMLNSHMKSHSSVYQYQCGDCKYATKYVHSLKMHLRKYNHQPAALMIDIFGRKRGPKPGSGRKQQQQQQNVNKSSVSTGKAKSQSQMQQCKILDLRVNSKLGS